MVFSSTWHPICPRANFRFRSILDWAEVGLGGADTLEEYVFV